jgi:hypothetical protein
VQIHRVLGVLFDKVPPPLKKQEAVHIEEAPGQIVLGGRAIPPTEVQNYEGAFAALTLADGSSILKRVGPAVKGMKAVRLFESIGGLGASEGIALEEVEGQSHGLRVMSYARLVLGVVYE